MDHLFGSGRLSPVQLAQVGQYAENVYFGKPCGLIDQLSCATGGVVAVDFRDPAAPSIQQVPVDLAAHGYALCIIDVHASHADLTDDYAAIPQEMRQAAACFGCGVLGQVPFEEFMAGIPAVRSACGDRAVLRAYHFYRDNQRVLLQKEALERGDFETFLHYVRQSGRSSFMYLQNVSNYRDSRNQPVALLLALAMMVPMAGAIWQARGPAGSMAAALPGQSRHLSPWSGWRALSPASMRWRGRAPAMSCPSAIPAPYSCCTDPPLLERRSPCFMKPSSSLSQAHRRPPS